MLTIMLMGLIWMICSTHPQPLSSSSSSPLPSIVAAPSPSSLPPPSTPQLPHFFLAASLYRR